MGKIDQEARMRGQEPKALAQVLVLVALLEQVQVQVLAQVGGSMRVPARLLAERQVDVH
jgi:hypothetical protein